MDDVIIIGGGASGMMAAITAAKRGKKVRIVEHLDKMGRKLLLTGNGRCNYSNENQELSAYRCIDSNFVKNVLKKFSQRDATAFFYENGILTKNRNGYLYPKSGQASLICDMLNLQCEKHHVSISYETECKEIEKRDDTFLVTCKERINKKTKIYQAKAVIVCTGGKTYPKTGSDGSGYDILKKCGHTIVKPLPALTALYCREPFFKALKGVRCDGKIVLYVDGAYAAEDTGELQLTDYGVSGIPVFQVSRYASIALACQKKVMAELDFLPDLSFEEILALFRLPNGLSTEQKLQGMVNKKLAAVLYRQAGSEKPQDLVKILKSMSVQIIKTGGFEQAQVCTGGVTIQEICSTTMESQIQKGLYLAGEVIDVDGICGGYNLQWAWSTGYIAGMNC